MIQIVILFFNYLNITKWNEYEGVFKLLDSVKTEVKFEITISN